jgi:FkbM family methyltransferase
MSRNENWVKNFITNLEVNENRIALDIGANHGIYSKLLATKFGKVYAFEPHPDNVARIKSNVTETNVHVEQKVVGTSDGEIDLFVCSANDGGHTIMEGLAKLKKWGHSLNNTIQVESVTLDTFCNGLDVSFIKCDIEGGEYEIFYQGEETLKRTSPTIILETHQVFDFKSDQEKRDKLFKFLSDLGFSILDTNNKQASSFTFDTHYLIRKI